jgi:hypothetical protein
MFFARDGSFLQNYKNHLQKPKQEKKSKSQLVCVGINAGVFQGENRFDF